MKLQKLLAVLLALLLLAACGGPADPTAPPATPAQTPATADEPPTPADTPTQTEHPEATEAPGETEPPAETEDPTETVDPFAPPEVVVQASEGTEEIWTYSDHYNPSGLQASDSYGALLPYVGRVLQEQGYAILSVPLYGLCTPKGEVVTDGIYRDFRYSEGFLLLERQDEDGTLYTTLAAQDGSWVTEEQTYTYAGIQHDVAILQDGDGGLHCWNGRGEKIADFPADAFDPWLTDIFQEMGWAVLSAGGPFILGRVDDVVYAFTYNYNGQWGQEEPLWLYLDLGTQTVSDVPPAGMPETVEQASGGSSVDLPGGISGYPETDPFTGVTYYDSANWDTMEIALYDENGTLLVENLASWSYFNSSRVMAGLATVPSAYTLETHPGWDLFDWASIDTGETVFRYRPKTPAD